VSGLHRSLEDGATTILAIKIAVGFTVGALMGMTGLGGGILLLPLLIVVLRVPAMIAIGSGTAFAAITKTGAAVTYWNRRQVDWGLVGYLACGSVPAGLLGIALLGYLRSSYGDSINKILSVVIGVLLLVIASLMMWRSPIERDGPTPMRSRLPEWITPRIGAVVTGIVGGFLVGATSMGAGSVIMILLLLFYNRSPRVLVGTDIFHGVILTTATTLGHLRLHTVDHSLVAALLLGSLPGVYFGSKLSGMVPSVRLRQILLLVLIGSGLVMARG